MSLDRSTAGVILFSCGAALLSACAGQPTSSEDSVTVVDSAGVQIVESRRAEWGSIAAWDVSDEPSTEIGSAAGDPNYLLWQVGRTVRLSDGRLVVANGGTAQLRFYDSLGTHLMDVGSSGDGPGEFRALRELWRRRGDSLVTFDFRQSRVSVFDSNGQLARTFRLSPENGASQVFARGLFDDGTLLVSSVGRPPVAGSRKGLFSTGKRTFERRTPEGGLLNEVGELPHGLSWGFTSNRGDAYTLAPFAQLVPPDAVGGRTVYLGDGTSHQIEVRAPDGALRRLIRWSADPRLVTADVVERYRHARLQGATSAEARQMVSASLDGMIYPERMPAYRAFLVDSEDHLWVEQYRARWEEARRWWVFDPTGRWLGQPPVPEDLDIREVGRDYILGVRRDGDDVEFVSVYALSRGG